MVIVNELKDLKEKMSIKTKQTRNIIRDMETVQEKKKKKNQMQVSEIEKIHWMNFKHIGECRRDNTFEDRPIKKSNLENIQKNRLKNLKRASVTCEMSSYPRRRGEQFGKDKKYLNK